MTAYKRLISLFFIFPSFALASEEQPFAAPEPALIYCDVNFPLQAKMRLPLAEIRYAIKSNCSDAIEIDAGINGDSYTLVYEFKPETLCLYESPSVYEILARHGASVVGLCFSKKDSESH